MFRKLCFGAAAVLSVGMLAVGCGDDGDTIIIGGSGDLTNSDAFIGSSISANNVSEDGGGISPNNQNMVAFRVIWCCNASDSDGTFEGNSDAMILFTTSDGTLQRVFATHFDGNSLTPPVELKAEDRDETIAVNINAAIAVCLTTAQYSGTSAEAQATRANAGNWVIVWPYTTFFNDPRLSSVDNHGTAVAGPRLTMGSTVWLRSLRGTRLGTSDDVNGVSQNFINGFQETATDIVPTAFRCGGFQLPHGTGSYPGATTTLVAQTTSPANNVTGFGIVSDALQGQASFGGRTLPMSNVVNSTATGNAATAFTIAHPNQGPSGANGPLLVTGGMSVLGGATNGTDLRTSRYAAGESMTHLGLFYTQINNSNAGGGSVGSSVQANAFAGGAEMAAFTTSFNLATLTWETATKLTHPVERNGSGNTIAGTAPYPTMHVANNMVFYTYADASLIDPSDITGFSATASNPLRLNGTTDTWANDETGGFEGGNMAGGGFFENINAFLAFQNDGDGTASVVATTHRDLSLVNTTPGLHNTTNPTSNAGSGLVNVLPNREMQGFNHASGGPTARGGRFIFGPDEGLADIVVFYTTADNTRGTAGDGSAGIDRGLAVATINPDGSFVTSGTTNPSRISASTSRHHQAYLNGNPGGTSQTAVNAAGAEDILQDPILAPGKFNGSGGGEANVTGQAGANTAAWFFDACMNRTGEYINVLYIQDVGNSRNGPGTTGTGFAQALHVVTYQTFRPATGTTGGTVNQPNHDVRFAGPTRISATTLGADDFTHPFQTNGIGAAEAPASWTTLPVNDATWQGKVGYRGLQSNSNIMSVLYEQSDATEDRLFSSQITVTLGTSGTPMHAATASVEYDSTATVSGHRNVRFATGVNTSFTTRSTFRFIDGDVRFGSRVMSCDLGADSTGAGGGLLVVYRKVNDATTSDNDHGDSEVVAVRVAPGATAVVAGDRVVLSRNLNENFAVDAPNPVDGTSSTSSNQDIGGDGLCSVAKVVCVPRTTDISGANASFSGNGVYVYLLDARANNASNSASLFTRKHDTDDRRNAQSTETFATRWVPDAAVATTDAGFQEPTQIDHLQANNVTNVQCCQNGESVAITWVQDGHIWGQLTTNGETYLTEGGAPNPALVDNDTSTNIIAYTYSCCDNGSGGVANAVILFTKNDTDNDSRLRGSVNNTP